MGEPFFQAVELSAPSHPHPRLPNAPLGNVALGRVVALFDRLRDAAISVWSFTGRPGHSRCP